MPVKKRANQEAANSEKGWKPSGRIVVYSDDRKYLDKVLPVRLPAERLEKIKKEARELGSHLRLWFECGSLIRSVS